MDFSGAGTAIMLALAAVLWFLYLLPNWMRRREFLATERNATRLQRAIRVMAETAEAPAELRVEATAREVARTERLVAEERRRADAVARSEVHAAELRARAAEAQAERMSRASREAARVPAVAAASGASAATALTFARLRRARRIAGFVLLAAVLVGAVQLWLMATTGIVVGSWVVIGSCTVAAAVSVRMQGRIARRARALATPAAAPARRGESTLIDAELSVAPPRREWTPVPVPKPLYVERGDAPRVPVVPQPSAEELLAAAAAEARRALVAAHAEPEVVPFRVREAAPAAPAAAPAAPSRFASMGIVDADDASMPDLDEVLRRRRRA